ncbi:hypothetical protein SLA2020_435030 [Shorea laevis]
MDKTKELYNLHEILDPAIGLGTKLKGLQKFVDLAMRCVEELGAKRPTMGEVVKEIENIMQLSGLNPNVESSFTSETYEEAGKGSFHHPYSDNGFNYSGSIPSSKIDRAQVNIISQFRMLNLVAKSCFFVYGTYLGYNIQFVRSQKYFCRFCSQIYDWAL